MCNHFAAFSTCCYVFITELASYDEKKNDVGILWWANFFLFYRLDGNGSISSKCMEGNHFVALSICCCAIITEVARYNGKKLTGVPCGGRCVCSLPVE